tara:strand:- start:1547 stop:1729 length:183 start_codon:yes stop_codon:yes gene_type:complete
MKHLQQIAKALGWHLTKRGNGYSMVNKHYVSCGQVLYTLEDVAHVLAKRIERLMEEQAGQ